MKLAQFSALGAAIAFASTAQANAFLEDSDLDLELRHYFKEAGVEDNLIDTSTSQWSQAFRADYSSGYFENLVGIDLNAYYALKLGASHADTTAGNFRMDPKLLPTDTDGDSHSYGKTGYAIKFNLMGNGEAKYGRIQLDTALLNDSDNRSLPSQTEAFYVDFFYEGLAVHAALAKKGNAKTKSGFTNYEVNGKKEAVSTAGGSYDFGNGLNLSADYATQGNFYKKYLSEVSYSTTTTGIDLNLAAQYAKASAQGDQKKQLAGDSSQSAWGVKANTTLGQISASLAYTKVESTDIGNYVSGWSGGDDDTSHFGYNSIQISDFNKNGQSAWGFNAGYDFAGQVEGLSTSATYVVGKTDPKGSQSLDEKEYNLLVTYSLPQLDGLTAQLKYAKNTLEQAGYVDDKISTDLRAIVKYYVAIF